MYLFTFNLFPVLFVFQVNLTSVAIINGFCQTLLCVYTFLGTISIGQIEVVLERVLLKLADGKGAEHRPYVHRSRGVT